MLDTSQATLLHLAAIVSTSKDAIISKTLDGTIMSWNAAAEKIYGYTADEVVGRSIQVIIPPERHSELADILGRLTCGESIDHYETERLTKDGRLLHISLTISPFRDADGQIAGAATIARDITARKNLEARLRRRAQQQAAVAQLGDFILHRHDPQLIFDHALSVISNVLDVSYGMILEYQPDSQCLLLQAAAGWSSMLVGQATIGIGPSTEPGFVLQANGPVCVGDYQIETRFAPTPFTTDVEPASGLNVVIPGTERPFGVLSIHSLHPTDFEEDDVFFVQATANLIGGAAVRLHAEQELRALNVSLEERIVHRTKALTATNTLLKKEVAERSRVEAALRRERALSERIVESSFDGILTFDTSFRYTSWNEAMTEMTGLQHQEVVGKSAFEVLPFLHEIGEEPCFEATLRGERVLSTDRPYHIPSTDRSGFFEATYAPLRDTEGEIIGGLSVIRDITQRKKATEQLEQSNRHLAARNRELQEFTYIASHDLQEPLRKVTAFAGLLRSDFHNKLGEEGLDYIDRMEKAAQRMSKQIQDLLSFSRIMTQGRPFRTVDLREVAADILDGLSLEESKAHVEVADLPTLKADPSQMHELLRQLVDNAFKFRREDVPLAVHITSTIGKGPGGLPHYTIEVRDNGIGFDEKYLDRIFSPFQRLHGRDTYEGTGIGLSICRRIVERHHGTITARSTLGEGATFVITLPVQGPDVATNRAYPRLL